jgi:hypothetical protein
VELDDVRRFALSLPEATEEPHFELTSFRVRGKIFATAPGDGGELRVFVDEHDLRAAVGEQPAAFEELWWGKRLSGLLVHLAVAPADLVRELLVEAWRRKAPKRLAATYDERERDGLPGH